MERYSRSEVDEPDESLAERILDITASESVGRGEGGRSSSPARLDLLQRSECVEQQETRAVERDQRVARSATRETD